MRLTCNIVRDLVGICTDCAATEETKEAVQAHLAECPGCARYYYEYKKLSATPPHVDEAIPEIEETSHYAALSGRLRHRRQMEMVASICALAAASTITAVLVRIVLRHGK